MAPATRLPRYPVYVPSKGRAANCYTARFLVKDEVPFRLVVEAEEHDDYASRFGAERILVLPFSNRGLIAARNWIKGHSIEEGHVRHWQIDDNIRWAARMWEGRRIRCNAGPALAATEDFTDRFENVAISGLNYTMFGVGNGRVGAIAPFYRNVRVYSCSLVNNSIPHGWRLAYNDDTDICLQVLADGWCTLLMNAFLVCKIQTMLVKGGNTDDLYQGDGRLRMARSLERMWPKVVETKRRFGRPQHVVKHQWRRFDNELKLRDDVDLEEMERDEYGLRLRAVAPVKAKTLRRALEQAKEELEG